MWPAPAHPRSTRRDGAFDQLVSAGAASANVAVGVIANPALVGTGASECHAYRMRTPGSRANTSTRPVRSSWVTRGKISAEIVNPGSEAPSPAAIPCLVSKVQSCHVRVSCPRVCALSPAHIIGRHDIVRCVSAMSRKSPRAVSIRRHVAASWKAEAAESPARVHRVAVLALDRDRRTEVTTARDRYDASHPDTLIH